MTFDDKDGIQFLIDLGGQVGGKGLELHLKNVLNTKDFYTVDRTFQQVNNAIWYSVGKIPGL